MYSPTNRVFVVFIVCCFVLQACCNTIDYEKNYEFEKTADNTYDYIVVGVGQGGSAAAGRLAEVRNSNGHGFKYSVLGIEWGDRTHRSLNGTDYVTADFYVDHDGQIKVGVPYTRFDVPVFASSISSPPSPYPSLTVLYNGKETAIMIGKLLGGSGAHNGQIWSRHTKPTIDSWGVEGWSYNDVLNFYKKSENVSESTQRNNLQYHGLTGPVRVSDTPQTEIYQLVPLLLQSCANLGYPANPDFNGASRYGCGKQVFSIGNGVRYSAAHAYLPSVMRQGNLKLELKAQATRILIKEGDGPHDDPIAYGVEFIQNGQVKRVFAEREIVIAMSAIFTPKILLASGIGPAADLRKLGIKVWVDSPNVGKGVQSNQIGLGAYNYTNANYGSIMAVGTAATQYALNNSGPFVHVGQFAYAYLCSTQPNGCADPDVMIGTLVGAVGFGMTGTNTRTVSTQVSNSTPKSKGTITLISTNPHDLVNLTLNSWEVEADLKANVYGWKALRRLFSTPPVSGVVGEELVPGPQYQTDAQLEQYVRQNIIANTHWVGSARFGNSGDPKRVTDPQLRVVGISGLRIGDGSIFPSVNSHLQASAAMAGERVADFILNP